MKDSSSTEYWEHIISEISHSLAQARGEFIKRCTKRVLPPCLFKAVVNGTHKPFAAYWLERNGVRTVEIIGSPFTIFCVKGEALGIFWVSFTDVVEIKYKIFEPPVPFPVAFNYAKENRPQRVLNYPAAS